MSRYDEKFVSALLNSERDRRYDQMLGIGQRKDTIVIDTSPLLGIAGDVYELKFMSTETISDFLDRVYYLLNRRGSVEAYTYGKLWLLENTVTGKRYDYIGLDYCNSGGQVRDDRSIAITDIASGSKLKTIPIK